MFYQNMNSGYSGYSMSNRAVKAYEDGEKPLSKFGKEDVEELNKILTMFEFEPVTLKVWQLKEWLKDCGRSSWHHTSSSCNETDFYSLQYALTDFYTGEDRCNMTKDDINNHHLKLLYEYSKKERKKKEVSQQNWYYADVEYGEWEGSRRHPKLVEYTGKAIIIDGWAHLLAGGKKKTDGSHFSITKKYGQRKPKKFDTEAVLRIKKKYDLKIS